MKIAIIAHSHFAIKKPFLGGLEAHTHNLTKSLVDRGHDVTLFCAEGSDPSLPVHIMCKETNPDNSNFENIVLYREKAYLKVIDFIKENNFDVVHNNSLHYVPLNKAATLDCPMVTVLHVPPFIPMINGFKNATPAVNHTVIGISKVIQNKWQKKLNNIRPNLVYNGIDTNFWIPSSVSNKKDDYAIYFGRITPEKGTHYAIKAAVAAKQKLKIFGGVFDTKYFNEMVMPLIRKHPEYVYYGGLLAAEHLRHEVANASVFVCTPCWDEPFGLVVAEAFSCGTPVAGFKKGALPEIVDEKTGILTDIDYIKLSKAIKQAKHLKRDDCRQKAISCFSHEKMIDGYIYNYNSAIQTLREASYG
jgi:glycosyltransferase involved in cell wall biosynthesis